MFAKNTAAISLPKTRTVRGYEIRRMPLGRFLAATETLAEFPARLLAKCFPGRSAEDAIHALAQFDADMLLTLAQGALTECAEDIIRAFAQVSGIPEDALRDDPEVGLDGLIEMVSAWWEVNNLANFIPAVKSLKKSLLAAKE